MFNLLSVGIVENDCRDSLTEATGEATDEATGEATDEATGEATSEDTDEDTDEATDEDTDEDTDGAGGFAVSFCRLPSGVCSHSDHPANAWNLFPLTNDPFCWFGVLVSTLLLAMMNNNMFPQL